MSALWLMLWAGVAFAEPSEEERTWGPAEAEELPPTHTDETVSERGELPDYDGRGRDPVTAGEVVAWVPRVVFAPVYLVERYVVYEPVRAAAIWTEKNNVPIKVMNALSFGDEYRFTVMPSALIDFGFRPSVGIGLSGKELTRAEHRMQLKAAWGGNGWYLFRGGYQVPLTDAARQSTHPLAGTLFTADAWIQHRPDYIFHGVGNETTSERTRFGQLHGGGRVGMDLVFGEMDAIRARASATTHRFDEGRSYFDDPLITDRFDTDLIPGFDGYLLLSSGADLILDSGHGPPGANNGVPAPGTAVRLEVGADYGAHLHEGGQGGQYVRWTAEGGAFLDLNGRNRTLAFRQQFAAVEQLGGMPTPFAELVTLGGNETMRGHLNGRFRGDSAVVTGVQYTWPIWVVINGSIEAELGGVFGPDFEGSSVDQMAASFAYGIRTPRNHGGNTQLMFGLGTTPLGEGAEIDTLRLVIGTTEGF